MKLPFVPLALFVAGSAHAVATINPMAMQVAEKFAADCKRGDTPNITPGMRAQLHRLCTCSVQQIKASDIAANDDRAAVNAKIQQAMRFCVAEEDKRPHGGK